MANNRLTWNNVAAPNFSGISDSYKAFSQLLGNAVQGGENMLGVFRDARQNAADNAIMQRMLSAEQYNPAAILGSDGSAASREVLGLVNNQADTLLKRQVVRDTHNQNQLDWGFTNSGREQLIENSGALNAAQLAAAGGDMSGYKGINVRADILNDYLSRGSTLASQALNRDSTRQSMAHSDYTHKRQIRADQLTDQTQRMYADLRKNGFDFDTWDAYISSRPDIPPEVANAAYAEISRLVGAGAPATGGGGGGGMLSRDELHARQRNAESANNPNARSNKGAFGLMQLMPPTAREWEARLGFPPGSTDRDPAINEQVGRAYQDHLLERYDGNQLHSLVAYNWGMGNADKWLKNGGNIDELPAETRGYVRKILGDSAGAQSGVRGRPASAGTRFSEQLDTMTQQAADSATGITGKYIGALSKDNSVAAAAKAVMEAGTLGEGVEYSQVFRNIERVMDTARRAGNRNVTPAIAAEIVERNIRSTGLLDMAADIVNPLRWFGRNGSMGTDLRLDTDRTEADINDVGAGTVQARLRQMFDREQDQARLTAADEAADAAAERLRTAVMQSQRRPGIAQHIPRLQQDYQRALDRATRLRGGGPGSDKALSDFITGMENTTGPVNEDIFGNRTSRAIEEAAAAPVDAARTQLPRNTPSVVPAEQIAEFVPEVVPGGAVENLINSGRPVSKATLEYHLAVDQSVVAQGLKDIVRSPVVWNNLLADYLLERPVRGAVQLWNDLPANRNYMPRRPEER